MTANAFTAGRERYYRRNIARGDGAPGAELTVSSSVPGVPPGVWHGQAARALGLSGIVSDAQMRALFGLGMHPDAEEIAARELAAGASRKRAMKAAKLGPAVPALAELSPLDQEIEQVLEHVSQRLCRPLTKAETKDVRMRCAARAFEAEYHRTPADGAELGRYLAARSGPQRRAVTGYDLCFSNEELSLLFALGGPEVRRIVLEVLAQARTEALAWIEHNALAVRTGPGGVAQQRAEPGLLAAIHLHYESRAGDPMLHEHAVISPRVKGRDGRWRNLDSRLLLRDVVVASELFNQRALELACARLGLATEEVEVTPGQRPVMQIVGIDARLRAAFAQRSHAVRTMAESLFDAYRRRHGRQAARPARTRLQWQATVKTRPPKRQARSLDDLLADWRRRAIAATDETVVDNLLATARTAAGDRPAPAAFDLAAAAEEVLAAVCERRTTFRRRHVLAEARRYLMRTLAGATAPDQAAEQITEKVLAHSDCLDITPPEINPHHPDLQRPDGTSIYRPIGSQTYTTHSLLAAENRLLAAARTSVIPPVGRSTFNRVAALGRGPMDAGQRALAASFVLSEQLLLAGLGPAGAGKTTAMKLVARAVDAAGGRLIPLAPSSRAAKVLGGDLDRRAHTLHSWLHQRGRATDGKTVGEDFQLRPGDVVLVDEAGMAGTLLLDEILADAAAAGAVVRLLGDPHQLAAVEAGGALRLISRAGGAVELDQLHRFRVPGEADASLILRDGEEMRAVFDWYRDKGRIVAGTYDAMCDMVFNAWAKDLDKGLTSLMTAADTATVTALNVRAQAHHIAAGTVDTSQTAPLRAGQRAHVGDIIVTRLNRRQWTVRGGRDFVKNGDTWHIQQILPGGDVVVRHTQHRGRIRLPAEYLAAQCELGYASTIHRAQGMTVDTSHAIASARSNREGVYVQMTRGARTNRLYVALEDGDRLDDVLASIAARRRAQLSATESIAALQQEIAAPGQLSAEFADVAERATTARLTGLIEHTLGAGRAAMFMAADAYPALIRALHDAERAGFDLPRLLANTVPRRGFGDADDPSAVLTWRLCERLKDAAEAQQEGRSRPLAALTLTQLHTLTKLAAAHRAAAREALEAADAAFTHLPMPVTTRAGHTHPAWDQRPMGELTRRELAAQLSMVRTQIRRAQTSRTPLSATARHVIADLTRESQLRRALNWRDAAREDYQREQAATSTTSTAAIRRTLTTRRTATADRQHSARAALARADAVSDKIYAELRFRERLPDHAPHRPNHRTPIPDWVADSHALVHPDTPEHWATHLAERHRILARSLADRGHTLAAAPPAWARPLGTPPPTSAPRRRHAWATTAALVELWRTRHAITGVPGLGPRPADVNDAAAWDDLDARVRALTGRRRPVHLPPPDAPSSVMIEAALSHLDSPPPGGPLPDHPALRDPLGITPLSYGALDARLARRALAAVLAGEPLPEAWMEEITAPGEDDEDEQRTYTKLLTAIGDYRRRHHRAGPDVLGPRPAGLDGEEFDHLTDAIDLYTHARVERRLEQMRARTAVQRAALLPPTSPLRQQHPPDTNRPGHRPPTR
ncbi:conjugative relaxase-like TrwC/TraI family protein [Streptomyces sp. KhCrAH-43]|uniref:MobF family relaxase n=1 Tax=unclassified Streptomyces TaxID=2593676 RepID=UPI00037E3416|nr:MULTISPECIES: MobF family relaxase [unclassified Streptomyces]MYS33446.1 relaxase domain-containing protein [Streptomyces sp. SID4920]MYX67174.1 relaxase domain-containing protein [Streptomyces sp. SID8373]RAJ49743.1 conjugative relaxase-like TrwC/TraI family protein [Streptomyces sp. KhCrAH-43]